MAGATRLKLYSRALAFAVAFAWVISLVGSGGADAAAGRLGGDYPAFYAAGSIVADGDWAELYSPDRQLAAQEDLFGADEEGAYLYFAYPPYVAKLYEPLAALDYRLSYAVHTLAMAAAAVGALALLRPVVPLVARRFELIAIATLLFYPMLRAVTGGQNTGLTLLLLAAAWRSLHDDNDALAGVAIGLLLYKPQFTVPLLGLLLLRRHWKAVATGVATGALLWVAGAVTMGSGWMAAWWDDVSAFAEADADVNGHNAISWLGFAEGVLGAGALSARVVAAPLVLATIAGLMWVWLRRDLDLNARMAFAVAGIVLLSPHAMFYDAGILVLPAVVLVATSARATAPVTLMWALAWTQAGASALGFAPLFVILVAGALYVAFGDSPQRNIVRPEC